MRNFGYTLAYHSHDYKFAALAGGTTPLKMAEIVRTALSAGAKHLFVEQDISADSLNSIAVSWRFLAGLTTGQPSAR